MIRLGISLLEQGWLCGLEMHAECKLDDQHTIVRSQELGDEDHHPNPGKLGMLQLLRTNCKGKSPKEIRWHVLDGL